MLKWPPGKRSTDGVWAKHWYASVEASTEFLPFSEKDEELPAAFNAIYDRCIEIYDYLYAHRLTL